MKVWKKMIPFRTSGAARMIFCYDVRMAWIIVGLGNPGEDYIDTRHNTGRMAVERFAKKYKLDAWKSDKIARAMVARYGMDPALGHVRYEDEGSRLLPQVPGFPVARRDYSEATAREIDEAVRRLLEAAFARATQMLVARRDALERGAAMLLERETLAGPELAALAGAPPAPG